MKIILFSGTAWRHIYFANEVLKNHDVVLNVRMKRTNNLSEELKLPASAADAALLKEHNDRRNAKEKEYFLSQGEAFLPAGRVVEVASEDFNGPEVISAVKSVKADLALVYGTTLIKKPLLEALNGILTINLHAGLSPWYRGSTTLFWPIYFMEPQYAGCTFHVIDARIDHGQIIHQNRPEIFPKDELHDIGCRAIVKAAQDIGPLLRKVERKELKELVEQKKAGKVFYSWDFKPHHLRITNQLIRNEFFSEYLSNKDRFPDPFLITQFKII